MAIELPVVSFVGALIVLVPLPWHWKTRNVCTTSLILWLAACNVIRVINTIIWIDNSTIKYEVWCDINMRVIIGANIGVPAATVCICRRLAQASAPHYIPPRPSEKRQRMKFEIGMCIVLPTILNGLHVAVESCRFAIAEGFGCGICYYPSIPALFLSEIPTVLLSWTALVYSGKHLVARFRIGSKFQQVSQHTQPTPASGSYLRLVALAITQMTFASVMSLFLMTTAMQSGINPWTSWEDVHQDWRQVLIQPKSSLPEYYRAAIVTGWYFVPITSVTAFGYFGFDDRVVADYKNMFSRTKRLIPGAQCEEVVEQSISSDDTRPSQMSSDANNLVIDMGRWNEVSIDEMLFYPSALPLSVFVYMNTISKLNPAQFYKLR